MKIALGVILLLAGLFVLLMLFSELENTFPRGEAERGRWKGTMANMRTLGVAVEAYQIEMKRMPPSLEVLSPTYIKTVPRLDGWGTPYRYLSWEPDQYMIISAGKDKKFERANPNTYAKKVTTDLDCDIVFSNGEFIQFPEQRK